MANAQEEFENSISIASLTKHFVDDIKDSRSTGVDMLTAEHVETNLSQNLHIINKKALSGDYKFTRYKLKLISKGPKQYPREISIPTVRDKIALKALNAFLQLRLKKHVNQKLPQLVVKEFIKKLQSSDFDTVIRLDVKSYYPSIRHDELLSRLRRFIKYPEAIAMVESALATPTTTVSQKKISKNLCGVPQGLSISNVLANLYLRNIDNWGGKLSNACYFRYVDDILMLCDKSDASDIKGSIIHKLNRAGLSAHKFEPGSKSTIENSTASFDYLGYSFNARKLPGVVSVRDSSIEKLKNSIIGLFTAYSKAPNSNDGLLKWRMDLRITGCINEKKTKGWLFYFSELNDKQLLFELDHFIEQMKARFKFTKDFRSFVKAWHEIKAKKWESHYFPNFDNFTDAKKLEVIMMIRPETKRKEFSTPEKLDRLFRRLISREVRELEIDILDFS